MGSWRLEKLSSGRGAVYLWEINRLLYIIETNKLNIAVLCPLNAQKSMSNWGRLTILFYFQCATILILVDRISVGERDGMFVDANQRFQLKTV